MMFPIRHDTLNRGRDTTKGVVMSGQNPRQKTSTSGRKGDDKRVEAPVTPRNKRTGQWLRARRKAEAVPKLGGARLWILSSTSCLVPGYLSPSARRRLEAPGLRLHRIEVDARFRVSRRILPDWVTLRFSSLVAGN